MIEPYLFKKVLAYLEMPTRGDEDVLRLDV
jgi:hypothetical protein